jgi:threonine/homoserine/homoserine lactone efflux protein
MLEYLTVGMGLAFTAAVQPGPLQAYLLSSVAQRGWVRTLPACLAPLLSDGPIVLLSLLLLNRIPATVSRFLQAAGGVLLLFLAGGSYRAWRREARSTEVDDGSAPATLLQAAAVNILNPSPYLGWTLILGPTLMEAWHQSPAIGVAFVVAFYGTMVTVLAGTIFLMGTTRFLGPRGRRTLVLVSSILMAVLGLYQLVSALLGMGAA